MMRTLILLILGITVSLIGKDSIEPSIVKIFSTVREYDYESPWSPPTTSRVSGSGFVIDGERILTNAHAVVGASFVEVCSSHSKEMFEATVKMIGNDCDLAILEVKDRSFFEGKTPLKISEKVLPQSEEVKVYGFPMGGSGLSVTKGIVSRVEMGHYAHSGSQLLISQIDAPINPGNSGGPVIANGEVVGVAHQGFLLSQNIGYMIPIPVIQHFLEEVQKEEYQGFPRHSFKTQIVRNPAMRDYYGLGKGVGGLLILSVPKNHFLYDHLLPGDILVEVDSYPIDPHGRVRLDQLDLSLPFQYLLMMKHFGDEVVMTVIREGEQRHLTAMVDPKQKGAPLVSMEYDKAPSYFISGGFVFQPLVGNYVQDAFSFGGDSALFDLVQYLIKGEVDEERDEVVVLSRVLDDIVNVGYQNLEKKVVDKVNGKKIKNLKDLVNVFESAEDPFYIIETTDQLEVVLDRDAVLRRNGDILRRYFISSDRSPDLSS